jgi:hypothetical protein
VNPIQSIPDLKTKDEASKSLTNSSPKESNATPLKKYPFLSNKLSTNPPGTQSTLITLLNSSKTKNNASALKYQSPNKIPNPKMLHSIKFTELRFHKIPEPPKSPMQSPKIKWIKYSRSLIKIKILKKRLLIRKTITPIASYTYRLLKACKGLNSPKPWAI